MEMNQVRIPTAQIATESTAHLTAGSNAQIALVQMFHLAESTIGIALNRTAESKAHLLPTVNYGFLTHGTLEVRSHTRLSTLHLTESTAYLALHLSLHISAPNPLHITLNRILILGCTSGCATSSASR